MKKLCIIFILIYSILGGAYGSDTNTGDIAQKVVDIDSFLEIYQSQYSHIEYDYPVVSFESGIGKKQTIDIVVSIKDKNRAIVDYEGILNIQSLIFGKGFSFSEIPKTINISKGQGKLQIEVTEVNQSMIDDSGLGIIFTANNSDLVGNIGTFAYAARYINPNDYINVLVPQSLKTNTIQMMDDLGEYTLYKPKRPNTHEFKSISLNENGEFIVEYNKNVYDRLIQVYGGKGILGFDPKNTYKYNFTYRIEDRGESVFVTVLKEGSNKFLEFYANWNPEVNDSMDSIQFDQTKIGLRNIVSTTSSIDDKYTKRSFAYLSTGDYVSLGKLLEEGIKNYYEQNIKNQLSGSNLSQSYDQYRIQNSSKFSRLEGTKLYIVDSYLRNDEFGEKIDQYLASKYRKNITLEDGYQRTFVFDIQAEKKLLDEFIVDVLYRDILFWKLKKNDGELYMNRDNNLYFIGKTNDYYHLLLVFGGENGVTISCGLSNNTEQCSFDEIENVPDILFKKHLRIEKNTVFFDISSFLHEIQLKGYYPNFGIEDIFLIDFGDSSFEYPYIDTPDLLPVLANIKSPKEISTNPYLISLNFLLALLYLLVFYFTAQLFNSYFEELSEKKDWNNRLANFFISITEYPLKKIFQFLNAIFIKKQLLRCKNILNKIASFLKEYEHNIFIFLCLIILGIIGQIIIDDFDILSLRGWVTIVIMILVLAFVTLLKDLLLYLFHKKSEKDNLKIEAIPTGYILSFIVALFGRFVGMIPSVMFGSVIRITSNSSIASRKLVRPSLLLRILVISFVIGVASWFSTLFFIKSSFFYNFFMITYFGLINDTFFALLPFGMLWGIYIFKDRAMRRVWFIFAFVVFVFLLHTIINPEGDLHKILQFDGNLLVLFFVLFFWIIITALMHFYIKKSRRRSYIKLDEV
ncbi:hypothetical protein HOO68_04680 [Candidatus Gracilibacteria bacterium]|nr:hypothetical protein [Candidatus Gracilibacteria bacterium]